jgi:hypothetical protein
MSQPNKQRNQLQENPLSRFYHCNSSLDLLTRIKAVICLMSAVYWFVTNERVFLRLQHLLAYKKLFLNSAEFMILQNHYRIPPLAQFNPLRIFKTNFCKIYFIDLHPPLSPLNRSRLLGEVCYINLKDMKQFRRISNKKVMTTENIQETRLTDTMDRVLILA